MIRGAAWVANSFGEPEAVLERIERTWDEPPEGHLLARVTAAGINLPDRMMIGGIYPLVPEPPVTPGLEIAGEVIAARAGSRFAAGDRVFGMTAFCEGSGGFADFAYMPEARCRRIPAALSNEEAAGFYVGLRTAHAALVERVALRSGETLLVLGGAGSSGATAIQVGRALGATVIAVAGNAQKTEYCRRIGAHHVVNYRTDDLAAAVMQASGGKGADVIFDPVGGDLATRAIKLIARNGRIAMIGFASGVWPKLNPIDMVMRSYAAFGVYAGAFTPEQDMAAVDWLIAQVEAGGLTVPIGRIFAFEELPAALQQLGGDAAPGKLVLRGRAASA